MLITDTRAHYWRGRLAKKAPFVGVKVWFGAPVIDGEELDRSPRWQCLVRNETTSRAILEGDSVPITIDGVFVRNLERITEAEYQFLVAHSEYSTAFAPHNPDASPTEAIDVTKLTSIF